VRFAPHSFSLRQLQYAVCVADTRSFRRAAELCHVAQPSLSAQIAQLESALGVRLFERGRGGVLVTAAGEVLLVRARRLLLEADDLGNAAAGLGDPFQATVRIGVIPTVSPYLLPAAAPAIRRALPRLHIRWVEEKTPVLAADLAAGRLDAMLVARESQLGEVEQEEIAHDPFVFAAPRSHPLSSSKAPLHARELNGLDVLLLDDGHCFREQALAVCERARAHELDFRATSLTTLVEMVAAGSGVTLLPRLAVAAENRRAKLCVRPFRAPTPGRTLVLAWRRGTPVEPVLRSLAKALRESGGAQRR